MNPAVQTKTSDGFKFKSKGDNWKTTSGRQPGNNWKAIEKQLGTKATGSRQLGGGGGRVEDKWERIGSAHLEQNLRELEDHMCKTNAKQLGDKWETTSWNTTRKQRGDKWKTLGDNGQTNSGRQMGIVEGNWKTIGKPPF